MRIILALTLLVLVQCQLSLGSDELSTNESLGTLDYVKLAPQTAKEIFRTSFDKKAIPVWLGVAAATGVLFAFDEQILSRVQLWGRSTGVGNKDNTRTLLSVGTLPIFRGPTDVGSGLYFIGDGWTHAAISASFLAAGAFGDNDRAFQTGNQLMCGMIMSTIPNQMLKRGFGRESPSERTQARGAWRPFPSIAEYSHHVSGYDAMPSGHVMTATMTMTVIDSNYPEYRHIVLPAGMLLIGALGLEMINNGVHWASDYPIGMALGYVVGKVISRQRRVVSKNERPTPPMQNASVLPFYKSSQTAGKIGGLTLNFPI